jgi:hypothetical protein
VTASTKAYIPVATIAAEVLTGAASFEAALLGELSNPQPPRIPRAKGGYTHGASGYTNYHCRCSRCGSGHADQAARMKAARTARLAADPALRPHGSDHTYSAWGCRCRPCKSAHADAARGRYERARLAGAR